MKIHYINTIFYIVYINTCLGQNLISESELKKPLKRRQLVMVKQGFFQTNNNKIMKWIDQSKCRNYLRGLFLWLMYLRDSCEYVVFNPCGQNNVSLQKELILISTFSRIFLIYINIIFLTLNLRTPIKTKPLIVTSLFMRTFNLNLNILRHH